MAVPGIKPQNFATEAVFASTDLLPFVKDLGGLVFQDSNILLVNFLASGGAMTLQGDWNAATNMPALVSSTGTKGFTYRVSALGSTVLDGISTWEVGDFAYFDGAVWRKQASGIDPVVSVFGRAGAVVSALSDYDASQVDNDSGVSGATVKDALDSLGAAGLTQKRVFSFTATASQTIFNLPTAPTAPALVTTFRNGNKVDYGVDFTVAGSVLTWIGTTLLNGDGISGFYNDAAVPIPVLSVHARTGDVVSVAGDYDASQVDNDSTLPGVTVADALNSLGAAEILFLGSGVGTSGSYNITAIAANGSGQFTFNIPLDFASLVSIELIGIVSPGAAGAAKNIDLTSEYALLGQASNFNTESDTTSTYDLTGTSGQMTAVLEASGVFSSIEAGDFCGLNVNQNAIGGGIDYLGIRLRYLR